MADEIPLFDINPALDRAALAERFARNGRLQIANVLTAPAAEAVHHILARETPWGLGWQAGDSGPQAIRRDQLDRLSPPDRAAIGGRIETAMRGDGYAFSYARYPMLDAYLEKWAEGSPQDLILEHINSAPFLDLVRDVTGIPELKKADAQATLYAPNQFLSVHDDSHVGEGWRIAYVLSMCAIDWRPDWGGYLLFLDEAGDVIEGFRPRFNALNLFAVPQKHNVSFVPPFAPIGRFAITGWFRDR